MWILESIILAIGVSMDAFAVAISTGISLNNPTKKQIISVWLWFAIFQMGMPLIGYLLWKQFSNIITNIDHRIAFVLLSILGIKMIMESMKKEENKKIASLKSTQIIWLSIAVSIDALAVGITLAFIDTAIYSTILIIGITTCLFSTLGMSLCKLIEEKRKKNAEIIGGIILMLIGLKILIEHLAIA